MTSLPCRIAVEKLRERERRERDGKSARLNALPKDDKSIGTRAPKLMANLGMIIRAPAAAAAVRTKLDAFGSFRGSGPCRRSSKVYIRLPFAEALHISGEKTAGREKIGGQLKKLRPLARDKVRSLQKRGADGQTGLQSITSLVSFTVRVLTRVSFKSVLSLSLSLSLSLFIARLTR